MITTNLQYFGGRGSAGGTNMGGSGESSNNSENRFDANQNEFTFKPKDLKNPEKDWGGYNKYSETALQWGKNLTKTLKPGDVVTITRTNKDGTTLKTSVTVVTPEDMDKQNAKSKWEHVRNSEPTAKRYKDELKQGLVVFAKRSGQSLDKIQDSKPDNKITYYYGSDFTDLVSTARSKIKDVKVTIKRKKRG